MNEFSESKINQEQWSRLQALKIRLAPLLAELPKLQPWVRRDENSMEAKRFSDIVDIQSPIGSWLQYLESYGSFPEDQKDKIIPELEKELERLEQERIALE